MPRSTAWPVVSPSGHEPARHMIAAPHDMYRASGDFLTGLATALGVADVVVAGGLVGAVVGAGVA
jgi:hypothetical protein